MVPCRAEQHTVRALGRGASTLTTTELMSNRAWVAETGARGAAAPACTWWKNYMGWPRKVQDREESVSQLVELALPQRGIRVEV